MKTPSNSIKRRFALKFLRTLVRIRKSTHQPSPSQSSTWEIRRRAQRIKLAAYSSMARTVGSKRAWSRALTMKLRAAMGNRPWSMIKQESKKMTRRKLIAKRKRHMEKDLNSGVQELRRLVPGGQWMDPLSLMQETAHFLRCLETQVRVMRSIVAEGEGFPC
ncbi:hypothetical protein SAY87_018449 [Trapa incisa]|uniref:BHLH domain-containing protein n=2 Tax=Trapa TaxID=22665 RepID=A0AAN7LQK1_TRANT|nr:hypothetical protein SAY87_018449 [Trapa incisa]KAK4783907.1 hypothetical protein SAY86_018275 [Trapa natans]